MSFYDDFKVELPEGELDGLAIERFEVPKESIEGIRLDFQGRSCPPGQYTRATIDGRLWMSDTPAEARDHSGFYFECKRRQVHRVLINGLGLGCIVHALLKLEHVEHIDVVEIDKRVCELVGTVYERDPRVTVTCADAYEQCKAWPKGTAWDAAWHDIWPDLCEDNLPEMARLHRSYGRRVGFQRSWGKELLESQRRRTAGAWWR